MKATHKTGFVILAHHNLHRTAELATALTARNCKVAVHVDAKCPNAEFEPFAAMVAANSRIVLSARRRCEWGKFSLTQATMDASRTLLENWPELDHICHLSGDSLPVRPLAEFLEFLAGLAETDIIESVSAVEDVWVSGGLGIERFRYWFPFAWRRQRKLFDLGVALQRKLGISRRLPENLEPHLGSQWWCLTARTMRKIISDPQKRRLDRYFDWCWIPDESYFQTLVRKHSSQILSRSFMLSRFDDTGQPHIYYDDHQMLLASSGAYFARKIWHGSQGLYQYFLDPDLPATGQDSGLLEAVLARSSRQMKLGRTGLVMAGRFPVMRPDAHEGSAKPFDVVCGFDHAIAGFRPWLADQCSGDVHGRLFGPDRAQFANGRDIAAGCLPAETKIRDSDPTQFLRNVLWGRQGGHQTFLFDAKDNQILAEYIAHDAKAHVHVLAGAWALELFQLGRSAAATKSSALRAIASERRLLNYLSKRTARADVKFWNIHDYLQDPGGVLGQLLGRLQSARPAALFTMPKVRNFVGLSEFLTELSNLGVPSDLPKAAVLPAGNITKTRKSVSRGD